MAAKKLKPEVAEHFDLAKDAPIHGGFPGFGEIDLSEIDLETAKNLVANGFTSLVKKTKEKPKP